MPWPTTVVIRRFVLLLPLEIKFLQEQNVEQNCDGIPRSRTTVPPHFELLTKRVCDEMNL